MLQYFSTIGGVKAYTLCKIGVEYDLLNSFNGVFHNMTEIFCGQPVQSCEKIPRIRWKEDIFAGKPPFPGEWKSIKSDKNKCGKNASKSGRIANPPRIQHLHGKPDVFAAMIA